MNFSTISYVIEGGVARIDLNRPALRNAFNEVMIAELTAAFLDCAESDLVRVVVLGGRGAAFCAGADLHWMSRMADFSYAENLADASALAAMLAHLYEIPKPVVASVNGDCYAGGMGLVAACDIVVAASAAVFCLSEVRLGLIPATISPYVIEAIGPSAARRYFLTAERISASVAQHLGLVHEVVERDALETAVTGLTTILCANSPAAMREAKRLIRDVALRPIDQPLMDETAGRIATIRGSAEGREGVRAFLDKRDPAWRRPPPASES